MRKHNILYFILAALALAVLVSGIRSSQPETVSEAVMEALSATATPEPTATPP